MAREITNLDDLFLKWFQVEKVSYDLKWVKEIKYLERVLKFVPFLKQVGVCNSVSMGLANAESDIDLFVVTHSKRVYIVRIWMVLVFQVLGKRRHRNKIKNRFCLSFFVDEDHTVMSDIMIGEDYYFDFWVKNIWWLLEDNDFIKTWNSFNDLNYSLSLFSWKRKDFKGGKVMDFINWFLGIVQRLKAHNSYKQKNFPKGVIFEEGIIKCHDEDIRWKFRDFISSSLK